LSSRRRTEARSRPTSRSEGATVIRQGQADDVEPILDLLAHYERPRSYFEPFYVRDPTYRPEHSWVAEQGGWNCDKTPTQCDQCYWARRMRLRGMVGRRRIRGAFSGVGADFRLPAYFSACFPQYR
jgi:hypothetical protein